MALTTEQLVLLNNMMYMEPGSESGCPLTRPDAPVKVSDWINSIDVSKFDDSTDYGSLTTGGEWKDVIEAIKQDPAVMDMKIETTHVDYSEGGGGGYSAVFVSESTGDAVVVFAGTAGVEEWKDNFKGGNVTDTQNQKNALEWYQDVYKEYDLGKYEVTVSGHSKGGNKSKYITIMDETVDNCVSFDGQGFSDKFMEKYASEIAGRQSKIHNHNVDYDYVNILLNDVGDKTYYKGQNYTDEKGQFLENHCMNTFMKHDGDGKFHLVVNPDGQPKEMKDLDSFFNGYLRSLSDGDREDTLELINMLVQDGFSLDGKSGQEIADLFINTITDSKYSDDVARLLAYAIRYEQQNPEAAEGIKSVLGKFGLGELSSYVDMVDEILNIEGDVLFIHYNFDTIMDLIDGVGGFLLNLGFVLDIVSDKIYDATGIRLTHDQIKKLFGIAKEINKEMDQVQIQSGEDIVIQDSEEADEEEYGGRNCSFYCNIKELLSISADLNKAKKEIEAVATEIVRKSANLSFNVFGNVILSSKLINLSAQTNGLADKLSNMNNALNNSIALIRNTEKRIMN